MRPLPVCHLNYASQHLPGLGTVATLHVIHEENDTKRFSILPDSQGYKLVTAGNTKLLHHSTCDLPGGQLGMVGVEIWNIPRPETERTRGRRWGGRDSVAVTLNVSAPPVPALAFLQEVQVRRLTGEAMHVPRNKLKQ